MNTLPIGAVVDTKPAPLPGAVTLTGRFATVEELESVSGIGPALAASIAAELATEAAPAPAVNLMTGEILDDEGTGA